MSPTETHNLNKQFPDDAYNIVQGVKLPPQPRILMAITKELHKKEASFAKIQELLSKDAAIAAKLLKLVNSPYFSNGKKIDSIERALTRLGLLSFYTIVLSSCLREALGRENSNSEKLWEHTQVVAGLARNIAQISKSISSEYAYMAGLFHDAALPIMLTKDRLFDQVITMDTITGGNINEYEANNTNTKAHHSIIGNILARSWGLPEDVCEAILFHHTNDFDLFSNGNSRALGMIIMLADMLARQYSEVDDANETADDPNIFSFICKELNLDEDDVEALQIQTGELAQMAQI